MVIQLNKISRCSEVDACIRHKEAGLRRHPFCIAGKHHQAKDIHGHHINQRDGNSQNTKCNM